MLWSSPWNRLTYSPARFSTSSSVDCGGTVAGALSAATNHAATTALRVTTNSPTQQLTNSRISMFHLTGAIFSSTFTWNCRNRPYAALPSTRLLSRRRI